MWGTGTGNAGLLTTGIWKGTVALALQRNELLRSVLYSERCEQWGLESRSSAWAREKDLAPLSLAILMVSKKAESEGGQLVSLSSWGMSRVSTLPGKGRRPGG